MEEATRKPAAMGNAPVPRGQVYVIPERCKGCDFCITFCPKEMLKFSEAINGKGYHYPTVIEGKGSDCVHCRFCSLVCPEMAIFTRDINDVIEEA